MANKRIILLSDGTGNSAGKVWRTNVWRTFESLDLTSSQQIAFYDDGVGTSSFKPFAILGGAFGFGLKRNVLDIYKFACRNYRSHLDYLALEAAAAKAENREEKYGPWQSDDIFAFGFSRGAFTIRVVNGLICEQGLVSYQTEEELDRKVATAYRAHRAECFKSRFQVEWVFRKLRNLFVSAKHDKNQRPVDHIAFLGLWDTVAAYGLPIDEMTRGVSRYLWPLELPDRQLNPLVRKACHALSLDDERTTFHPLLWDESPETVATGTRGTDSERITQVWFAGVHSNVGGGYPDNSLAHVSLTWILSEAKRRGLTLKEAPGADPDAFKRVRSTQDKDGRIYDSRNGLGGYYRYGPRSVAALSDTRYSDDKRDCVKIASIYDIRPPREPFALRPATSRSRRSREVSIIPGDLPFFPMAEFSRPSGRDECASSPRMAGSLPPSPAFREFSRQAKAVCSTSPSTAVTRRTTPSISAMPNALTAARAPRCHAPGWSTKARPGSTT